MEDLQIWAVKLRAHLERFWTSYLGAMGGLMALSIVFSIPMMIVILVVPIFTGLIGYGVGGGVLDDPNLGAAIAGFSATGSMVLAFMVLTIVLMMLMYPLYVGFYRLMLARTRGQDPELKIVLDGFRRLGPICVFMVVSLVATFGAMMLCYFPALLLTPLFILGFCVLADHDLSGWDSVRFSVILGRSSYVPLLLGWCAVLLLQMPLACIPIVGPLLAWFIMLALPVVVYEDLMQRDSVRMRLQEAGLLR